MPDPSPKPEAADRYLDLVRQFPLRPIRSDAQLDQAIAVIDSLIDKHERDADEDDYLDVLGDLVERYETETIPLPPVSDAEMLRYLIETRETSQAAVSQATGVAESSISEILSGKRALNRKHIEAFARFFKIDPGAFLAR